MLKMKNILFTLACLLNFSFGFSQDPGTVDTSFGTDGIAEYTLTIDDVLHGVRFYQMDILPDGKMLAVGMARRGCSNNWYASGIMMRLHPNGDIDTSFHNTGYLLMSQTSFRQAIPENGNFLYLISPQGVLKVDMEGNIDTSYGNNGLASLSFGTSGIMDAQGNLYVTGRKNQGYTPVITKLNTIGEIDTSFGTDGEVTFPHEFRLNKMTFNSMGDIIIVGREYNSFTNTNLLVMKMKPNGELDSSFADEGIFMFDPVSNSNLTQLHILEDDKILAFGDGALISGQGGGLAILRLNTDGTLDSTFQGNGMTNINVYGDSTPYTIHPIENNGFIISGTGYNNMFAIKIDQEGNQDMNFGIDGAIITPTFEWSGINLGSLLLDNKVLFYGMSRFSHCAQTKYKAYLTQYYISDSSLSSNDFVSSKLDLYPNPVIDKLQVPIQDGDEKIKLKLFDIGGAEIKVDYHRNSSNEVIEMDLSNVSSGVYFLMKETNGERKIRKIIKL